MLVSVSLCAYAFVHTYVTSRGSNTVCKWITVVVEENFNVVLTLFYE